MLGTTRRTFRSDFVARHDLRIVYRGPYDAEIELDGVPIMARRVQIDIYPDGALVELTVRPGLLELDFENIRVFPKEEA